MDRQNDWLQAMAFGMEIIRSSKFGVEALHLA